MAAAACLAMSSIRDRAFGTVERLVVTSYMVLERRAFADGEF